MYDHQVPAFPITRHLTAKYAVGNENQLRSPSPAIYDDVDEEKKKLCHPTGRQRGRQ